MGTHRLWVGLALCVAACMPSVEESTSGLDSSDQAIIYTNDDRLDVYAHPNPELRALTASSVVSLIPRSQFTRKTNGDIAILTRTLGDAFDVCSDARFAEQPTAAMCSGVLIDDDLVLTAGHCFPNDACERYAFVFDYYMRGEGELESISWGDIYGCRRIVDRSVSPGDMGPRIDFALVQLDRPALGRTSVELRTTPLLAGEPLAAIGSASGLPVKIDTGARVLNTRAPANDYFLLDSDTFEGSSGSGIFDVSNKLVGVLVRGGQDYELRAGTDCMVPKVVQFDADASLDSLSGEEATYIGRVAEALCAKGWPSRRLCGREPLCGDGFCTSNESRASCASDCGCTGGDCALSTPPASAGAVVPKANTRHEGEGCALAERPLAGSALLVALAALLGRRRNGRGWRFG